MNIRTKNIIGQRFGRVVVLAYSEFRPIDRQGSFWLCKCDCGNEKIIHKSVLSMNNKTSCGCYMKEQLLKYATKHGQTSRAWKSKEYSSWEHMKSRCYKMDSKAYANYGGRGITVCDRWINSFENFLADMGKMPTPKHSIDRIDVNGDYTVENCRWADTKTQSNNKRTTVYLTYKGIVKSRMEWCVFFNFPANTIKHRMNKGQSFEQAFKITDHTSPNYKIQHREILAA